MKLSKKEQQRLKNKYGKWAIVTGATSGIGKELAMQLAQAGLNLVINARTQQNINELKAKLEAYSIEVIGVAVDTSTREGITKLLDQIKHLDIGLLIVSAGFGTSGLFIESELEQEIDMLQLNCTGLMILTHHFSKYFANQKRGGIILLSSIVAFQGVPYAANYAATKAYVQSLGEAIALELKPFGVDVLAAAPGPVASSFGQRANMKMDMSLTPAQVGVPMLKALGRKSTSLPGFLTKFLVYSLRTAPRWGKVRIMRLVMGGMTKHQRAYTK